MKILAKHRPPTPEQQQKAAERRERFRELARQVSAMSDDQRAALVARVGGLVTVEGHPLTVVNSCLILSQLPTASMVGGFRQWLAHGRCVRKGEHGLGLWIPTGGKSDAGGPADIAYCGEPVADAADARANPRTRFIMGTVFDVSQTDEAGKAGAA